MMDFPRRPLVTIAIPTYNRANGFLRVALESALAQSYAPLEIIVSDNCSPDNTEAVVRSYTDPRLRYFRHNQPVRPNDNFNFCVMQARGDYLLLLHDDDVIDRDLISICLDAAHYRTDIGIIRTGTRTIDADGRVLAALPNNSSGLSTRDFFLSWFSKTTALYMCSTLYNTAKLREAGGFHSRHNLFQDGIATAALAAALGRVDVRDIKASFRVHEGELTGAAKVKHWCEDSLELLEKMCRLVGRGHAATIRNRGMRFFAEVNYSRASRVAGSFKRIDAFFLVFRLFGYRYLPPWRLILNGTSLHRYLRQVKQRVLGHAEAAG